MIKSTLSIDEDRSIVIVGVCTSNKYLLNLVKPETTSEAEEVFGNCDVVDAFKILKDTDIDDVWIINLEKQYDFLNICLELSLYNFTYILPVGIYLSDGFYDAMNDGKYTYYGNYLLNKFRESANYYTKAIISDKPADLYEDIDSFLDEMYSVRNSFIAKKYETNLLNQIIFVSNNLSSSTLANVYLASMLCNAEFNEYPTSDDLPEPVFDIDTTDNIFDMAYFKKHSDGTITVENLLNLDTYTEPLKIEFINRIINHISLSLRDTKYLGCFYNEYTKKNIEQETENKLNSFMNYLLVDFNIKDIYTKETAPATVDVYLKIELQPITCVERITLDFKVGD
jgi:hypothetical protein